VAQALLKKLWAGSASKLRVILSTAQNEKRENFCSLFVCWLAVCRLLLLFRFSLPPTSTHRLLAALYLTLGSLMAGNRILMDFVISSATTATTATTAKLCVFRSALVFAYFSAVCLGPSRGFCVIDIFLWLPRKVREVGGKPLKEGEEWAD